MVLQASIATHLIKHHCPIEHAHSTQYSTGQAQGARIKSCRGGRR